jgi:putative FmdB family regulatory protein
VPTYQYACTACDHSFEQFQSFSDDALTVCPQCQGRLRKVYNAVGVVFKGSGFYRTDSRSDAKTDAKSGAAAAAGTTGDPAGSTSGEGSTSSTSSTAKPATSTPASSTSAA